MERSIQTHNDDGISLLLLEGPRGLEVPLP